MTLWSAFAIFEPWIWRRFGPFPACFNRIGILIPLFHRKPFQLLHPAPRYNLWCHFAANWSNNCRLEAVVSKWPAHGLFFRTFFMAYRWWSLVNDDGLIDRIVERTEPENMKQFRFMFASKTREKLNDGHLYYSIFARPVESHFTRCQRCSCAMCILLLEFCVSAMYYQTRQEVDESSTVWVGPIKFNIAEVSNHKHNITV